MISEVIEGRRAWHVEDADCLEALRKMPDESLHALVTDPPAGISFMNREWDSNKGGRAQWVAWFTEVMQECLRVLKPGAHALVWAIPRTAHWTATAIEDAGFEVRDVIAHHFGTGFPKSLDVSKAIDKAAGAERAVIGRKVYAGPSGNDDNFGVGGESGGNNSAKRDLTAPATPDAEKWQGWGTALKPATEFWILARKPLAEKNVAANVLEHGAGALNVDGCRIAAPGRPLREIDPKPQANGAVYAGRQNPGTGFDGGSKAVGTTDQGRWPANLVLSHNPDCVLDCPCLPGPDHDLITVQGCPRHTLDGGCVAGCPVAELDAQSGILKSGTVKPGTVVKDQRSQSFGEWKEHPFESTVYGDSGGASRFFFVAKPDQAERNVGLPAGTRNGHPTVKTVELMQHLCRLITPPGGIVLDPFAGSGSTGMAALREGFRFIGIEQDPEWVEAARLRIIGDAPLFNDPDLCGDPMDESAGV